MITGNDAGDEIVGTVVDHVWAYDLGGGQDGGIEWGQFGGGPHHQGLYPVPKA